MRWNYMNECNYEVDGINAQFGINSAKSDDNDCCCKNSCNMMVRREMLDKIRELSFAIVDLAQYLNTHPEDERALCLHRKYANELRELKEKYQMVYGPLSIYHPCNKWRWLEEPWPWEGSEF